MVAVGFIPRFPIDACPSVAERRLEWTFLGEPLPKGELRIARQLTAGFKSAIAEVPQGRLNFVHVICQFVFSLCIQHKRSTPLLDGATSGQTLAISGWHCSRTQMKAVSIGGVEDHVH